MTPKTTVKITSNAVADLASSSAVAPLTKRQQTDQRGTLIKLPLELIFMVVQDLSWVDRRIIAQTCTQLRQKLRSTQLPPSTSLLDQDEEHCELLARVSRDDPNVWACEKCMALHQFQTQDTGPSYEHKACPWRMMFLGEYGLYTFWFWPRYRHVQLALKLHRQERLEPIQAQYLRSLMSYQKLNCYNISIARLSLRGYRVVLPKIVQGRYLLKIVQYVEDMEWTSKELFLSKAGDTEFRACDHQVWLHGPADTGLSCFVQEHRREESSQRRWDLGPDKVPANEQMETAVRHAFYWKGKAFHRSCPCCPTDFTVQIWERSAVLSIWADLGGETPITNKIWDVYKQRVGRLSNSYYREDALEHEPGSVRQLYQSIA